jgi:hypothetical protein
MLCEETRHSIMQLKVHIGRLIRRGRDERHHPPFILLFLAGYYSTGSMAAGSERIYPLLKTCPSVSWFLFVFCTQVFLTWTRTVQ